MLFNEWALVWLENCTALKTITVSDSVNIGEYAFEGCPSLVISKIEGV